MTVQQTRQLHNNPFQNFISVSTAAFFGTTPWEGGSGKVWEDVSFLSISGPGSEARPGKFDSGVGMGGWGVNLVAMEVCRRLVRCLGWRCSLYQNCRSWEETGEGMG